MEYIALDVHKKYTWARVENGEGARLYESRLAHAQHQSARSLNIPERFLAEFILSLFEGLGMTTKISHLSSRTLRHTQGGLRERSITK
jgi:hypothetical protein